MKFSDLFSVSHPVLAVIHLPALPGSSGWKGDLDGLYAQALSDARLYAAGGADAVVLENFNDVPFYPENVPPTTVAAMAALTREVRQAVSLPVGVNVLRNDAAAALSIAAACGAQFIRVNVHTGAMVTDQGLVQGRAFETMRLRASLQTPVLVMADVHVKHAAPLAPRSIGEETLDLVERGLADAVIVSGSGTGAAIDPADLKAVKAVAGVPVFTGSGVNQDNLSTYFPLADGFIVGSAFKTAGKAQNGVEQGRVADFMGKIRNLRKT